MVVTVCGVNRSNRRRKGLEAFVRTAAYCPHLRFVVVGAWMDDTIIRLRAMAQPNVCFTGWVSHNEKVAWLSRASVIMQPSIHEAFGLSVAEGMLCGAVPVVTANGGLPELVGDCGVLVESQDPKDLAEGVCRALALGPTAGARARTRVLERFTLDRRRGTLESVISGELDDPRDSALPNPRTSDRA